MKARAWMLAAALLAGGIFCSCSTEMESDSTVTENSASRAHYEIPAEFAEAFAEIDAAVRRLNEGSTFGNFELLEVDERSTQAGEAKVNYAEDANWTAGRYPGLGDTFCIVRIDFTGAEYHLLGIHTASGRDDARQALEDFGFVLREEYKGVDMEQDVYAYQDEEWIRVILSFELGGEAVGSVAVEVADPSRPTGIVY